MTSQKLFKLEQEIANLVLDKLEHLEITPERASQIAKFVITSLPENLTDDQIEKVIPNLDEKFWELAEIVHKHFQAYEDASKDKVVTEAEKLIHQGRVNDASQLMKKYFSQEYP